MHASITLLAAAEGGFFDLGAFELLMLALAAGIFVCLVLLLGRARSLEDALEPLETLDELPPGLRAVTESMSKVDLQRIEHLLIDLRDAQKRLREQLIQLAELPREVPAPAPAPAASEPSDRPKRPAPPAVPLSERVTNRLLALGYQRVQILSESAELDAIGTGDGDVLVEARRDGATCKGRVTIKNGTIAEVAVRSNHDMFP